MVSVQLRHLTVDYGGAAPALDDVTLSIADGEAIVVAGPSGGGKTTLLRTIAGLQDPTAGDVLFDGQSVTSMSVRDRDIALIGSQDALYRHLDVESNLRFPLARRAVEPDQQRQRVAATARLLRLSRLLRRKPHTLSGGERQRAALGRATSRRPRLFLFDEPLAQVEPGERRRLTDDLRTTQQGMGVTTIFVTHDQRELMTLGGRLVILDAGRVEQVGTPLDLYRYPATTAVATFVGEPPMSLIRGDIDRVANTLTVAATAFDVPAEMRLPLSDAPPTVLVGVRAEHLTLAAQGGTSMDLLVRLTTPLGARQQVTGDLAGRPASRVTLMAAAHERVEPGDTVPVSLDVARLHIFNAATGQALHPTPSQ